MMRIYMQPPGALGRAINPPLRHREPEPLEVTTEHEIAAEALTRSHWLSHPEHREWMGDRTSARWALLERHVAVQVSEHGPQAAREWLAQHVTGHVS